MACIFCSHDVENVWSLGKQPPSDTFCDTLSSALEVVDQELSVGVCTNCGLCQNCFAVDEYVRYEAINYSYGSANSNYARSHWQKFVNDLDEKNILSSSSKILEIGSNDGYLLNCMKVRHPICDYFGLDASPYQVEKAAQEYSTLTFQKGVFGKTSDGFASENFDLVIANNVLNHSNDLASFLHRVQEILSSDGYFVFEVPSLDMMFLNNKWDQIYHEHMSYFSINSITNILPKMGLDLVSIELTDYHGGSFRVTCQKIKIENRDFKRVFNSELSKLRQLKIRAEKQRSFLLSVIEEKQKLNDRQIYLFGAPAKGVTFINYCGLKPTQITGCLEKSRDKIGKYIPKSGIEILDQANVKNGSYAINLLWNIPDIFTNFCNEHNLEALTNEIN